MDPWETLARTRPVLAVDAPLVGPERVRCAPCAYHEDGTHWYAPDARGSIGAQNLPWRGDRATYAVFAGRVVRRDVLGNVIAPKASATPSARRMAAKRGLVAARAAGAEATRTVPLRERMTAAMAAARGIAMQVQQPD